MQHNKIASLKKRPVLQYIMPFTDPSRQIPSVQYALHGPFTPDVSGFHSRLARIEALEMFLRSGRTYDSTQSVTIVRKRPKTAQCSSRNDAHVILFRKYAGADRPTFPDIVMQRRRRQHNDLNVIET
ncbi:hypothetical protein KIN20_009685 [Parelaphostrongylus tenuis]|uniref:Uncharacterized protein n=1 Tax=Parelaphostrongylus tenuis TaxID=148309 RepID=A0AAD5M9W5_PARTN|nr:hypothetical protein KIN20_009685 [Parelaphostrongylus tenuis]